MAHRTRSAAVSHSSIRSGQYHSIRVEHFPAQAADGASVRIEAIAAAKRSALQDYIIAFNLDILEPIQTARGVLAGKSLSMLYNQAVFTALLVCQELPCDLKIIPSPATELLCFVEVCCHKCGIARG